MRHRRLYLCALLGSFILTAQNPKQPRHYGAVSAPEARGDLTSGLDLDLTNVGPNFKGHDVVLITERIKAAQSTLQHKSEFETTEQFNARAANWLSEKIVGTTT